MTDRKSNLNIEEVADKSPIDLAAKGVRLSKDAHYYSVVSPMLSDDHRYAYVHKDVAVLFNLGYEQMRFVCTKRGGHIRAAIKGMREILENCEQQGVKFCRTPTKGFTCCDLANLGAFQIKFTLNLNLKLPKESPAVWMERQDRFQQQLLNKYRKGFRRLNVPVHLQFDTLTHYLEVTTQCRLGSLPTDHVKYVTLASRYCIREYKSFTKKEEIFQPCMLAGMDEFFEKVRAEEKDPFLMNDNDLNNAGDELVESGYLVENTLAQDWADTNPETAKKLGLVLNVNWQTDLPLH